jgi:hypothetical protein
MHNCATCVFCDGLCNNENAQNWKWENELGQFYPHNWEMVQFNTHPAHNHPCEHGKPVVASAVAGVTFNGHGARHDCREDSRYYGGGWHFDGEEWVSKDENEKFCRYCGLRLPTPDELAQMYEAWKEAGK